VTFRQVRQSASGSLRAAGLPSVGSATRALYNDEVAKKKRAARPALRTSARRLRATLLPFALPSFVAERARSMRQRDAIDAGGEEPEPYGLPVLLSADRYAAIVTSGLGGANQRREEGAARRARPE
jgi:hypothetical protein